MGRASRKKWESRLKTALTDVRSGQKLPWYESNLFWGPLSVMVALVLSVLAVLQDLRWLLWGAWVCSWLTAWSICKNIGSVRTRSVCISVIVIGIGVGLYKLNTAVEPKKEGTTRTAKELSIAVFMECQLSGLPFTIQPRSTLHMIALNKKRMEDQNWGFYQIPNNTEKPVMWPDQKKLDLSRKLRNLGAFAYTCEVANSGSENIIHLAVPIDVWFGNDKQTIKYRPIVSSLGVGKNFSFSVVNDCPVQVSAAWQDIPTKVTILGESRPREITLKRKYRNPVEQIMVFMPSTVQWVGEQPCA